jgi:hypothetical protein
MPENPVVGMPRFKHYNDDQDAMVVINYQEQLQPGTFEHAVHYLIEHKPDLSVFHPKYHNEDIGRLAGETSIIFKALGTARNRVFLQPR